VAGDGPRFLVDDGAPAAVHEESPAPPVVDQCAANDDYLAGRLVVAPVEPSPELRTAIAAVFGGTSAKPGVCAHCQSADCAPIYLMLSNDQFAHERRFRFKHGTEPVRQRFAPHVAMMCTPL
jgi:hypothetical protein